ncbi:hypothetical protein C8R44DRAFT_735142 [Mycena epipterygia]|nr:hypothetical protein C8R44DRAFT_735142 [Mycena epipterygia]
MTRMHRNSWSCGCQTREAGVIPSGNGRRKIEGKWIVRTLPTIVRIVGDRRSSKWGYMSCQEVNHEQRNGKRKGASGNQKCEYEQRMEEEPSLQGEWDGEKRERVIQETGRRERKGQKGRGVRSVREEKATWLLEVVATADPTNEIDTVERQLLRGVLELAKEKAVEGDEMDMESSAAMNRATARPRTMTRRAERGGSGKTRKRYAPRPPLHVLDAPRRAANAFGCMVLENNERESRVERWSSGCWFYKVLIMPQKHKPPMNVQPVQPELWSSESPGFDEKLRMDPDVDVWWANGRENMFIALNLQLVNARWCW